MNRVEIKNRAKSLYRDNIWFIWKPLIIITLILALAEGIVFGLASLFDFTKSLKIMTIVCSVMSILIVFAEAALYVGYSKYILSFVRGKKLEMKDIFDFAKKYWVVSFLVSLLTGLAVLLGFVLLIIPGYILAIGLMFYREVCADNPDKNPMEIVKISWNMTKGHKMDLFIMGLSFLGWELVGSLTFGIGYIWIIPYMLVSFTLAYEELKKAA